MEYAGSTRGVRGLPAYGAVRAAGVRAVLALIHGEYAGEAALPGSEGSTRGVRLKRASARCPEFMIRIIMVINNIITIPMRNIIIIIIIIMTIIIIIKLNL